MAKRKGILFKQTFDDPLFALAFHPTANVYATGLGTGRVSTYKYNIDGGIGVQSESWGTKRHKSSCRALGYDYSGEYLYSVGSDKVIKKASSETGKVSAKNISAFKKSIPTVMRINEKYVAVGDESSTLRIFDQRSLEVTHKFPNLHFDMITSISDMSFKNSYHFITTGSTTLVHLDIRKGVLSTSDEHNDEFLCGCVTSKKYSVFGMSEGTITTWENANLEENEKNGINLSDQSVDCIITGEEDDEVYAGCGDGIVYKVNVHSSKKETMWTHSREEEVSFLDLDYNYRLVSGSMETVKVWRNESDQKAIEEEEEEEERRRKAKRVEEEGEEEGESKSDDDSDEESKPRKKKKTKGQKKAQKGRKFTHGAHGIASFEGL